MGLGYSTRAEPGQDQEIASCASIYSHPNDAMVGRVAVTYCGYKMGLTYRAGFLGALELLLCFCSIAMILELFHA